MPFYSSCDSDLNDMQISQANKIAILLFHNKNGFAEKRLDVSSILTYIVSSLT